MESIRPLRSGSIPTRSHKEHADPGVSPAPGDSVELSAGSRTPAATTAPQDAEKISTALPLDKHLEKATAYILGKTEEEYPGFLSNSQGKTMKSSQISSHLRDFIEFVKEKGGGDFASLPENRRKDLIRAATEFTAGRIGDEYGMLPHMRRNPIFLSPIRRNIGDYLEFLQKENVVLTCDGKGRVTATQFFSRQAALDVVTGTHAGPSGKTPSGQGILRSGSWILINGVKLPISAQK
jgi:hypothetical protein